METAVVTDTIKENKEEKEQGVEQGQEIKLDHLIEDLHSYFGSPGSGKPEICIEEIWDFLLKRIAEASRALKVHLTLQQVIEYMQEATKLVIEQDKIFALAPAGQQKAKKIDAKQRKDGVSEYVQRVYRNINTAQQYALTAAELIDASEKVGLWDKIKSWFNDCKRGKIIKKYDSELNKMEMRMLTHKHKMEKAQLEIIHKKNRKLNKLAKIGQIKKKAADKKPIVAVPATKV